MTLRVPCLRACAVLLLSFTGCDEGTTLEPLSPSSFDAVSQSTDLELSASPSFADERGGGVFVDLAGRVVRVRPNGTRGVLESHPRNAVLPGPTSGVFPLGPTNALVATSRGFFVADQGWLISPAWQATLPAEGLRAATLGSDGVAWLGHEQGLFRLDRGSLSEFTLSGESLTGVVAVAVAPTLDGTPGVWFARDGKLFAAAQTSRTEFKVRDSGLGADALGSGVIDLVGVAPARDGAGELWAITTQGLLLYTGTAWRHYTLPATPRRLLGAGRFAWMQAGDALYRYDGDTRTWAEAKGLDTPTLLSIDAAGTAWVRSGTKTIALSAAVMPRVRGLAQSARVFDSQLVLEVSLPTASPPDSLSWAFDDHTPHQVDLTKGTTGTGPTADLRIHSLGGTEVGGLVKPVSFATLDDGWHTLAVTATTGGKSVTRRLHFEFLGSSTAAVSFATDVRPLAADRCDKCHTTGTEPELATYEQWKANAPAIAAAVRDARMPADGPLDAAGVSTIVRWVNGGTLP
ncbi:MAG: hypothetical protein ACOZQL_17685 [Myxococcota bacterium]